MFGWTMLGLAILFELIGTTALKYADGFRNLPATAVVIVGYALSFWLFSLAMRTIELSIGYAIWSAVGTAATALIGVWLFNEGLPALKVAGLAVIVVGVMMVSLTSTTVRVTS